MLRSTINLIEGGVCCAVIPSEMKKAKGREGSLVVVERDGLR